MNFTVKNYNLTVRTRAFLARIEFLVPFLFMRTILKASCVSVACPYFYGLCVFIYKISAKGVAFSRPFIYQINLEKAARSKARDLSNES